MRVIISAGGTGGHIYPALAIINKIKEKEPNSQFLYIGTHNRMEKDIIPKKNIPFKSIEMYGFNKKHLLKNFKTIKCLFKSFKKCKKIINEFKPDIVIGVGGYVTVPVIVSAKKLGYKTFIHEQNIIPGKANRYLEKYCDLIGVSFEESKKYFKAKTVLTGNPCGEDATSAIPITKTELGLSSNKKLIVIVAGSLGSSTLNTYLTKALKKFDNPIYEVLFITGRNSYEKLNKVKFPNNVKVIPFYEGLPKVLKRTDIIITRAGASTLSEIISLEVPSILIPSPYVANNHQYINAKVLVDNNAATMIEEKDLKNDVLLDKVNSLITDNLCLRKMKENLKKLKVANSAEIIYNEIKKITKKS